LFRSRIIDFNVFLVRLRRLDVFSEPSAPILIALAAEGLKYIPP
jgi:hypothetical protein